MLFGKPESGTQSAMAVMRRLIVVHKFIGTVLAFGLMVFCLALPARAQSPDTTGGGLNFDDLLEELQNEIDEIEGGGPVENTDDTPDPTDPTKPQDFDPAAQEAGPDVQINERPVESDGGFNEAIDGVIPASGETDSQNAEEDPLQELGLELPDGFIRSAEEQATLSRGIYTLRDAVRDALGADPRIDSGIANVQGAQERVRQAKAALLPDISTNFSLEETDSQQVTSLQGTQITAGASLSQNIFSFGRNTRSIEEAEANVENALQNLRSIRQQVILETIQAYVQVLISEAVFRIRTRHREDSIELQTTAEERLAEGLIQVTDLRLVRSLYNQAESQLTQASVDRRISRNNLQSLTSRGLGRVSRDGFDRLFALTPSNLNEVITRTLETNATLKAALASVAAASARAQRSRSELLPTIGVQFSSQYSKIEDTNASTNSVNLNLSSPLYRGGLLRSSRRESLFALAQSEREADRVRIDAVTNARNAWTQYVLVQNSHSSMVDALASEDLAIKDLEEQADEGLVAFWQVLDARGRSVGVSINEATLRLQIDLYTFQLLFAVGELDDDNIDLFWVSSTEDAVEPTAP